MLECHVGIKSLKLDRAHVFDIQHDFCEQMIRKLKQPKLGNPFAASLRDDLVNLGRARLTGLLFAALCRQPRPALEVMWRDAGQHRSPNAGWLEGAMAGALERRLSGPRI